MIAAHHPTNAVVTLDFETNAASSVALDEKPISISVSPDGKHAAVNHGNLISYVDLVEMKVEDTFTPTKDLGDIVLAQDYIYGFPTLDGWTRIVCIKISDGTETLHTGSKDIRQQSKAKLHPNLDWLYTTEVENWPRGISKFSVTTGTAAYLYDEPKHGEYNFCAKIWIAPDGKRLYTRCMHIFTSTDDQETDIGYIGDLTEDGADELTELDVSPASDGAIVAILDKAVGSPYNSRDIMAFDPDLLTKTHHWKLPLYEGESNDYEINGDYVFVSNDGTRAYVIAMVADDAFAPADKDQQTFVFDLE
ncbi:hypothetical protein KDL45_07265 [bacterium]|nr:hypothetical protein [bacterium]